MPSKKIKEKIGYAIGTSSVGKILVACCELGILAIVTGKTYTALMEDLQNSFPDTVVHKGDWGAEATLKKVITFIETPHATLDLPLYMKGTPFQKRVWQEVCNVPYGTTATYAEIARAIGKPRAMRAVGSTCTKNNLFFAVPCHRIVRSGKDKQLGPRRQFLLDREIKSTRTRKAM